MQTAAGYQSVDAADHRLPHLVLIGRKMVHFLECSMTQRRSIAGFEAGDGRTRAEMPFPGASDDRHAHGVVFLYIGPNRAQALMDLPCQGVALMRAIERDERDAIRVDLVEQPFRQLHSPLPKHVAAAPARCARGWRSFSACRYRDRNQPRPRSAFAHWCRRTESFPLRPERCRSYE